MELILVSRKFVHVHWIGFGFHGKFQSTFCSHGSFRGKNIQSRVMWEIALAQSIVGLAEVLSNGRAEAGTK